ncbi:expressed unknown protein [Seminavis robusta]|uniref:Uncharacterized protein n=1 Tax=Seminavis robusta TaxID=568900 RepID=A0A9N8ESF0_9STRA|nr:expressed unknown protein [Seminavis robusta]|eukprot:Sro1822_g299860.1 n/a (643) ;mRNA; r:15196-17234
MSLSTDEKLASSVGYHTGSSESKGRKDDERNLWILPDDMTDSGQAEEHHRRAQAEISEEKVCKFFLHLNTTSAPPDFDLYNGVVFRLRTKNVAIHITSLELDLNGYESAEVKIFTKVGGYNATAGVFSDPSSWKEVTTPTAFAVATAERRNNIVPFDEFEPIAMEPKESRLIYVALPADVPLVKSAEGIDFNEEYSRNSEVITYVGYGVTGSEFFGSVVENRPFHGVVHYETKIPCEDQRDSFAMKLPYYVDQVDPPRIVESLVQSAIIQAVSHAMSRDAKLIRMQNIGGLRFQLADTSTEMTPQEELKEPCPFKWENCTKIDVNVHFGHDERLQPGRVHYEVLRYATDFNVSDQPFQLGYAGKMPLSIDYFITMVGAPKSFEFDYVQEAYFGEQTTKFLADMTGQEILAAGLVPTKRNDPDTHLLESGDNNDKNRRGLRNLQTTSAKVHAAIYGAYPAWPEPQHALSVRGVDSMATVEILQSAFDDNGTIYVQYLKDGLLRPGPINEDDRSAFFAGITGTDAELDEASLWMPTVAPTQAPTMDPDTEPEVWGMPQSTLKILAILFIAIGAAMCLFSLYWEYQARQADKEKLKRNARAAQRKVDKLRAEQYRRIAEKKKRIQNGGGRQDDDDNNSLTEPMIS